MRFAIALLALCALAAARPSKRYDGYQVLKIVPQTDEHVALLRSWEDEFDFWLEATQVGREVHMMVDVKRRTTVIAKLLAKAIPHEIHIADVQKQIDEEFDGIEARRAQRPDTMAFDYNDYNTYEDYLAELTNLATNRCPAGWTCSTEDLPLRTHEGRIQRVLKLFRNNPPQPRYAIWYDSQIHAREWLAGATLMKVVERIFTGTDARAVHFRENYDWYFLPIVNPDGYAYTWSTERLWRKNRKPTTRPSNCIGTDLNRNWPYTWSEPGASNDPCSETYYGDSAGSEIETQNVDTYAGQIRGNLVAWINFHTYGYYWLTNWGDCSLPEDHISHQVPVYTDVCNAIEATHGTSWQCGNSCQILYATSGSIIDHMKAIHGIRWAHTPELRGNSFIAAPDQIPLSYEEIWNGLDAKIKTMESIGLP